MKRMASVLAFSLAFAPIAAHADDLSGCLLGPSELHRCSVSGVPAAALAAFALPALTAGALVTLANDLRAHEHPVRGVVQTKTVNGKPVSHLLLLPPASDPDPPSAGDERPRKSAQPSPLLQFNEAATTATLAVAGAMAIGAFIATVVGGKKK